MPELIMERVGEHLQRLKLFKTKELLPDVLKAAEEQGMSHLSFLDYMLNEEVSSKEDRRVKTTLRIAGLPFEKTIDGYDFTFNPEVDKRTVMELV